MYIPIEKEELWPVYFELDDEKVFYGIKDELDIDEELWEEYKQKRDEFYSVIDKVRDQNGNNNNS